MEEAESDIFDKTDELQALMANFDVIDVNLEFETVQDYKEKLAEIEKLLVVTTKDIRKLIRTYSNKGMDTQRSQYWSGEISRIQADVRNHRDKIKAKVVEMKSSSSNECFDSLKTRELDLLERQVVAQESLSASNTNQSLRDADAKRSSSLIEAKAKADSILFDVLELEKAINETRDWKNATDITVKKP